MPDSHLDRRQFIQTSAATAAVLAGAKTARSADAASKLRIGFIGPGGQGFGSHVNRLCQLHAKGLPIELVALAEVYSVQRDMVADYINEKTGKKPNTYVDFREMFEKEDLDAVTIATPDHWHATQTIDALRRGINVYCEKPMTKTVEEALAVVDAWKTSGKVMQVGVQSTSLPVWKKANELLTSGRIGKVLGYQTEYFRNSQMGQWRYYKLEPAMTPQNIDWATWLGTQEGLAPDMPFDREVYKQWRRFWPFGSGMFTDLFVHRTTSMLKATGLRFPGRVVGAGGIYVEYDGRDVPDVATVVADFDEGVQGLVTASMAVQETPIQQVIRGHFGSLVFGNGEEFKSFEFVPERPQVTKDSKLKKETIEVGGPEDSSLAHFQNWVEAMLAGDPTKVNNDPELGAAAITVVQLGARSYREGKVFHFDRATRKISEGDGSWSTRWEQLSKKRGPAVHIPGWTAGDHGSTLEDPDYMTLAGPWVDGKDPAGT